MDWEQIEDYTQRARVHGGWLVKVFEDAHIRMSVDQLVAQSGYEWRIALAFVPDPNYEWKISSTEGVE